MAATQRPTGPTRGFLEGRVLGAHGAVRREEEKGSLEEEKEELETSNRRLSMYGFDFLVQVYDLKRVNLVEEKSR